jgi:DNA-binding transcriptional MerR regulator
MATRKQSTPKPKSPSKKPRAARPSTASTGLLRMGELSRRSGVPASTIKHYLREGLLPAAAVTAARNSALYDASLVERVVEIKELQHTHFLPLWRIKEVLLGKADPRIATVTAAVDRVFAGGEKRSVSRAALLAQGLTVEALAALVEAGLVADDDAFSGDDLALLETVVHAHRSGLSAQLPIVETLRRYAENVARLVDDEIALFRATILSGAGDKLAATTVDAMKTSERLVVLLRRRMLLPAFERAVGAPAGPPRGAKPPGTRSGRAIKRSARTAAQ